MNTPIRQLLILLFAALFAACGKETTAPVKAGHGESASVEVAKGPNGGRLLEDGDFTLELAIFEAGVPPEFRAWGSRAGVPLPPADLTLSVVLERLGGVADRIEFTPKDDFQRGRSEVYEPHSFLVKIEAAVDGVVHRWVYESFEGRTRIPAATAKEAGAIVETAGPRTIRDVLPLYGVIAANPEKVRAVSARFPGAIRSVRKSVGETVKAGEVLAIIESNQSLEPYALNAPMAGVVTMREANPGEQAGEAALFTITDLSQVVAELSVFPRDLPRLKPGQSARIRAIDSAESVQGEVVRVSPVGAGASQALSVRVKLANADGRWTPGLYVNGDVLIGGTEVPVAIKSNAIQRFRDWQVAFENESDVFEARPLELGRSDGEWTEVKSGLRAGARYVAENSFLIKADIEKSGASHDH